MLEMILELTTGEVDLGTRKAISAYQLRSSKLYSSNKVPKSLVLKTPKLLLSFVFPAHTACPRWSAGSLLLIISLTQGHADLLITTTEGEEKKAHIVP